MAAKGSRPPTNVKKPRLVVASRDSFAHGSCFRPKRCGIGLTQFFQECHVFRPAALQLAVVHIRVKLADVVEGVGGVPGNLGAGGRRVPERQISTIIVALVSSLSPQPATGCIPIVGSVSRTLGRETGIPHLSDAQRGCRGCGQGRGPANCNANHRDNLTSTVSSPKPSTYPPVMPDFRVSYPQTGHYSALHPDEKPAQVDERPIAESLIESDFCLVSRRVGSYAGRCGKAEAGLPSWGTRSAPPVAQGRRQGWGTRSARQNSFRESQRV